MSGLKPRIVQLLSPRARTRASAIKQGVLSRLIGTPFASAVRTRLLKQHLSRPSEVDIEVTSSCDADCIMCPRKSMSRRAGPMDFALFTKIVDESVALGVGRLCLNGYGEISTLRNHRDYVEYIRRKSRSIEILVNTNGMRMSAELAHTYVDNDVDVVNITIDGATAATFERIRQHLRLDAVERNVHELIRIRNASGKSRPLITVHMIRMAENEGEAGMFLQKWQGVADRAGIAGLVSRGGSVAVADHGDNGWDRTPCFLLWQQMPILSDGTVAMCCDDWDGTAGLGNVRDQSLASIWRSHAHQQMQATHVAGKAATMSLCDGCRAPRPGPWWFAKQAEP